MASPRTPNPDPEPGSGPDPRGDRPPPARRETLEEWEQLRRSVAMLPPRAWAMRREEALQALQSLVSCLRLPR